MNLDEIAIHFAHPAYQLSALFERRRTGIKHFQTWTREDLRTRIGEGDVLVISGYWNNDMLPAAASLCFIQVCGAGYDMFDKDAVRADPGAQILARPSLEMPDARASALEQRG